MRLSALSSILAPAFNRVVMTSGFALYLAAHRRAVSLSPSFSSILAPAFSNVAITSGFGLYPAAHIKAVQTAAMPGGMFGRSFAPAFKRTETTSGFGFRAAYIKGVATSVD